MADAVLALEVKVSDAVGFFPSFPLPSSLSSRAPFFGNQNFCLNAGTESRYQRCKIQLESDVYASL
jgi:hypothetical protein